MTAVFIAGHGQLYREALAKSLERDSSIKVIGMAADPRELIPRVRARSDALMLVDVATETGRTDLTRLLCDDPTLPVVAVGVADSHYELVALLEAGVAGYVTRDSSLDELVTTIGAVLRGEFNCTGAVAAALVRRLVGLAAEQREGAVAAVLTRREVEIINLIDNRLGNKQIANRLCISCATVKNHVHNILTKLEVRTREDAAAWFRRQRAHEIQDELPNGQA